MQAPVFKNDSIVKTVTLNLAQAADTYDALTASGDVYVEDWIARSLEEATTFDTVTVFANSASGWELISVAEGAVGELLEGVNLVPANKGKSFLMKNGEKIQYTIAGATGTGSIQLVVKYRPVTGGAKLT